ncbi:unnamed protein product [Trichogramma brassicae]|uniref:Uncharacterized protein n=1 Tax=Trichogramma brassicae TaxID=86971 RepID=A0A6H5J971_9HYME|nr:unnamed protein product [Trichogramma brassicae]
MYLDIRTIRKYKNFWNLCKEAQMDKKKEEEEERKKISCCSRPCTRIHRSKLIININRGAAAAAAAALIKFAVKASRNPRMNEFIYIYM